MSIKSEQDKHEQRKVEEYKKHPLINLADSINRSAIGDLGQLTKGNFLTKMITLVIIGGILFFARYKIGN